MKDSCKVKLREGKYIMLETDIQPQQEDIRLDNEDFMKTMSHLDMSENIAVSHWIFFTYHTRSRRYGWFMSLRF